MLLGLKNGYVVSTGIGVPTGVPGRVSNGLIRPVAGTDKVCSTLKFGVTSDVGVVPITGCEVFVTHPAVKTTPARNRKIRTIINLKQQLR